ncbi:MAG: hypothetical protein V5A40_18545 [Haloarculaceae archaeon]
MFRTFETALPTIQQGITLVKIHGNVFQPLQIGELFRFLMEANLPEMLIFGGLVFLFVAVAGNISGKLKPGRSGRIAGGVLGISLIVTGLLLGTAAPPSQQATPTATPAPTEPPTQPPTEPPTQPPTEPPTQPPTEPLGFEEDCLTHDTEAVEVRDDGDDWLITDGGSRMMLFDEFENAVKARDIIQEYGFDQRCFIGRPDPPMGYWLIDGRPASPNDASIGNEDCIGFDRTNLELEASDSLFLIVDGSHSLLAFDSRENAQRAIDVIQHYKFDRQCFVGRPNPPMNYWLSESQ